MLKIYVRMCLAFVLFLIISACVSTPENKIDTNIPTIQAVPTKIPAENLNFGMLSTLIGNWKVQDWQIQKNGEWLPQAGATWNFYAIQGDTAIRDEWKSNTSDSQQTPGFGSQLRVYNPWTKTWSAAWLSSRTRTLEFYTGTETESEVLFVSKANAEGKITRVIFSKIQENSFSWKMQWSSNVGETWTSVYKLQARRISE